MNLSAFFVEILERDILEYRAYYNKSPIVVFGSETIGKIAKEMYDYIETKGENMIFGCKAKTGNFDWGYILE